MKRVDNRRGQFFLLAAVILSAVVLSFGYTVNEARSNREADNFKDFTYEVKRETGAVLDYEIYSGFDSGDNITEFVGLLAAEMKERDPEANFIFGYGDHYSQVWWNEGTEDISVGGSDNLVEGGSRIGLSTITYEGVTINNEIDYRDHEEDYGMYVNKVNLCVSKDYVPESCIDYSKLRGCCESFCENYPYSDDCFESCNAGKSFYLEYGGSNGDEDYTSTVTPECFSSSEVISSGCEVSASCDPNRVLKADTIVDVGVAVPGGQEMTFPFSRHRQVIFLVQKEVENENYVATS